MEDDPLVRIVSVGRRRIGIGPRPRTGPPYPIALGGHALDVDAIVSRLQRAAGGVPAEIRTALGKPPIRPAEAAL